LEGDSDQALGKLKMDRAYEVSWQAGKITVHASSEKEAINIAIEYLYALENKIIKVTPNTAPASAS
jgi:hypothetical protein